MTCPDCGQQTHRKELTTELEHCGRIEKQWDGYEDICECGYKEVHPWYED